MQQIKSSQKIPIENRSSWMSEQHLLYGPEIQQINMDQYTANTYLEYAPPGRSSHISEYKNENEPIKFWHWGLSALSDLATNSKIPFFIVVGWQEKMCFWIIPINQIAKELPFFCLFNKWISERKYVQILWELRKMRPEQAFLNNFNNSPPPSISEKRPNFIEQ
jgi:hypothetical protein